MNTLEGLDWAGKRVLVIGLARSGLAAAELLLQAGAVPVLYDAKPLDELPAKEHILRLIQSGCERGMGLDPFALLLNCHILMISPAVPVEAPLVLMAKEHNLPVIGELELGYLFARGPIYAVTGTNGKTTTVSLLGEMFRLSGRRAGVCGNIGYPITSAVREIEPGDPLVAEVSSFQLETANAFHPRVAAVTNITPDHLDRHGSMERYIALKRAVFSRQEEEDFAVLNADDEAVRAMADGLRSRVIWFSLRKEVVRGCFTRDGQVILRLDDKELFVCKTSDIRLPGEHNLQNALAAISLAALAGIPIDAVRSALLEFGGVEHRIEFVRTLRGITYINDSKGTNPESTIKAVEAMKRPSVLLAGGYDKKVSFAGLAEVIARSPMIESAVLYGQTAPQLANALHQAGFMNTFTADTMFAAVDLARSIAGFDEGNILLSPACASFDQFRDYEQRGVQFKDYVLSLRDERDD